MSSSEDPNYSEGAYLGARVTIDSTTEAAIRAGGWVLFTRWHFNGRVRFEQGQFEMETWRHHTRGEVLRSKALSGLLHEACEKHGWD